ncbi:SMP-30/gluconolactonase/LRE family protein [Shewanella frigidimarina]|uniref:SMP-30/gluconolactonase/LRE family protein n=1 Tax=Shewanella frigidimarina TaxID=56812 RepID=UPI000A4BFEBE|nr:SMP-30/gluconolactonase/LRE family protein [Shewanella frigidimarina]
MKIIHYVNAALLCNCLLIGGCTNAGITQSDTKQNMTLNTLNETSNELNKTKKNIYKIYSPEALTVLDTSLPVTVLASGFEWVEGPVWSAANQFLLFSDIPNNKVFKYDEHNGLSEYLSDSGFSNGLIIDKQESLVLMQSRTRQVARMQTPLISPHSQYQILIDRYQGKRLNSPNDGVLTNNGTLFFTDPAYGLAGQLDDPAKELSFQGVYKLDKTNQLSLIDDTITFPNGIALSPDQKTLYVAASDPIKPAWYRYTLNDDFQVINKQIFFELPPVTDLEQGLPDGLKVHPSGIIFATGPNGLLLFNPAGQLLAKINLPSISANVAFNDEYSMLYITAHHQLLGLRLKE